MSYDPLDPEGDPFYPPEISTLVGCLHCGKAYDSYLIEWRIKTDADGKPHGFWCCPTPGCSGVGFGCDILPVDPDYQDERGGWIHDSDDGDDDDESAPPAEDERPDEAPPGDDEALPW